jgi:hypothetical protein
MKTFLMRPDELNPIIDNKNKRIKSNEINQIDSKLSYQQLELELIFQVKHISYF